jgi:hypothetical protein
MVSDLSVECDYTASSSDSPRDARNEPYAADKQASDCTDDRTNEGSTCCSLNTFLQSTNDTATGCTNQPKGNRARGRAQTTDKEPSSTGSANCS